MSLSIAQHRARAAEARDVRATLMTDRSGLPVKLLEQRDWLIGQLERLADREQESADRKQAWRDRALAGLTKQAAE